MQEFGATPGKFHQRWMLVLLLAGGQLLTCLLGLSWYVDGLTRRLRADRHEQVLADNRALASRFGQAVERMDLAELRVGTADWKRLQTLIEGIALPNDGFVCIVDSREGRLICHPRLRHDPQLAGARPGRAFLHARDGDGPIGDLVAAGRPEAQGWIEAPDGPHLIAFRALPTLDATLIVHRREDSIRAVVERFAANARAGGLLVALFVIGLTILLSFAILHRYEHSLAQINARLEQLAQNRGRSLVKTRDAVIFGLAKLAESRDDSTGQHLDRIRLYVELLAERLSQTGANIDAECLSILGLTSSLHDIGKVGVPDAILAKRGPLTPAERVIVQRHPLIGGDCLLAIKDRLGEDDFLETACEIALAHHEHWDGGGYPYGLKGEQIPLSARIVAVADVYDALTSQRAYKPAFPHEEARRIILAASGTQFDPRVVEAFVAVEGQFRQIAAEHTGRRSSRPDQAVSSFIPDRLARSKDPSLCPQS